MKVVRVDSKTFVLSGLPTLRLATNFRHLERALRFRPSGRTFGLKHTNMRLRRGPATAVSEGSYGATYHNHGGIS